MKPTYRQMMAKMTDLMEAAIKRSHANRGESNIMRDTAERVFQRAYDDFERHLKELTE